MFYFFVCNVGFRAKYQPHYGSPSLSNDDDDDDDDDDVDVNTVYECPGLAPVRTSYMLFLEIYFKY